jgi:hypothetical protein
MRHVSWGFESHYRLANRNAYYVLRKATSIRPYLHWLPTYLPTSNYLFCLPISTTLSQQQPNTSREVPHKAEFPEHRHTERSRPPVKPPLALCGPSMSCCRRRWVSVLSTLIAPPVTTASSLTAVRNQPEPQKNYCRLQSSSTEH